MPDLGIRYLHATSLEHTSWLIVPGADQDEAIASPGTMVVGGRTEWRSGCSARLCRSRLSQRAVAAAVPAAMIASAMTTAQPAGRVSIPCG